MAETRAGRSTSVLVDPSRPQRLSGILLGVTHRPLVPSTACALAALAADIRRYALGTS